MHAEALYFHKIVIFVAKVKRRLSTLGMGHTTSLSFFPIQFGPHYPLPAATRTVATVGLECWDRQSVWSSGQGGKSRSNVGVPDDDDMEAHFARQCRWSTHGNHSVRSLVLCLRSTAQKFDICIFSSAPSRLGALDVLPRVQTSVSHPPRPTWHRRPQPHLLRRRGQSQLWTGFVFGSVRLEFLACRLGALCVARLDGSVLRSGRCAVAQRSGGVVVHLLHFQILRVF
jgi:hypothetical protein